MILLDGLDEVPSEKYRQIETALHRLSTQLAGLSENNVVILTMRTQYYYQIGERLAELFHGVLSINPLTPSDIYDFLSRWPFGTKREKHIARIYSELSEKPTLRDMCSNPLVLAMYVAEDQAAGRAGSPDSRTEFYAKVTEELLIRRRQEQVGPTPGRTAIRNLRERILGAIALEHLLSPSQPANTVPWSLALGVTTRITHTTEMEAAKLLRELSKETGLISEERREETLRFIHLSFCEFLAAYEAIEGQQDGWQILLDKHQTYSTDGTLTGKVRLLEVLPFAAHLLPRVQRVQALSDIATLQDHRLLARALLETKLYEHPTFSEWVHHESDRLLAPNALIDSVWLEDFHLDQVVLRDAKQTALSSPGDPIFGKEQEYFAYKIKTFGASHREQLLRIIQAYARHDAAAAFSVAELCGLHLARDLPGVVAASCDQSPFFSLVLECLRNEPEDWAPAVVEGALASQVVAKALDQREPAAELTAHINQYHKTAQWNLSGLTKNTLYSQLQTISWNTARSGQEQLPLLTIFKEVVPPGKALRFSAIVYRYWPVLAALIGILLFIAATTRLLGYETGGWTQAMGVAAGAATIVLFFNVIRIDWHDRMYRAAFQIDEVLIRRLPIILWSAYTESMLFRYENKAASYRRSAAADIATRVTRLILNNIIIETLVGILLDKKLIIAIARIRAARERLVG